MIDCDGLRYCDGRDRSGAVNNAWSLSILVRAAAAAERVCGAPKQHESSESILVDSSESSKSPEIADFCALHRKAKS